MSFFKRKKMAAFKRNKMAAFKGNKMAAFNGNKLAALRRNLFTESLMGYVKKCQKNESCLNWAIRFCMKLGQ